MNEQFLFVRKIFVILFGFSLVLDLIPMFDKFFATFHLFVHLVYFTRPFLDIAIMIS